MSCHENKSLRDLPDDLDYDHVTLRVIVTVLLFLICPSNAVVKIHNQGSTFYVCWSVLTTPYFHHVPVQCGFKNKRAFWHQKVSDLEDDLSSDDYMHVAMLLNRWHKNETVSLSFFFFFFQNQKKQKVCKSISNSLSKIILSTFNNHHAIENICPKQQRKTVWSLYKQISKLSVKAGN